MRLRTLRYHPESGKEQRRYGRDFFTILIPVVRGYRELMKILFIKVVLLVFVTIFLMSSSALGASVTASLSGVNGKVEVSKGVSWVTAKDGDNIDVGVKMRTGADGSCLVTWGGGNAVKMQSLTSMTLEQLEKDGEKENSRFSISKGKALAKAKKLTAPDSSFSVSTPTAIAGVRGTDFAVRVVGNVSSVQVIDGSVEVGMDGSEPVVVEAGFEVTVPEGISSIPSPEPIPPVELKELQQNMNEVTSATETRMETLKEATKDEVNKVEANKDDTTGVDEAALKAQDDSPDEDMNSVFDIVDHTLQIIEFQEEVQQAEQTNIMTGTVQVDVNIEPK